MRLIGHLPDETGARVFSDFLYVQGIENQLEFEKAEGWGVWVNEEEKLAQAIEFLASFRANPADPKYEAQARAAQDKRAAKSRGEEAWRQRLRNRRHLFRPLTGYGFGPLTFALIFICVAVFMLSHFGEDSQALQSLFISPYFIGGEYVNSYPDLPQVRHGEIWRLFTPMFIHFTPLHILFNMLWLKDLGSMIEGRQSSWYLGLLVLVIAAGSNVAQFYFGHMPNFGGMSGVVYGLLGYVWIRGKLDPGSGLGVHPSTMIMMILWLIAGFARLLGPIANSAHLSGLVLGVLWGYLSSLRYR